MAVKVYLWRILPSRVVCVNKQAGYTNILNIHLYLVLGNKLGKEVE